MKQYVTPMATEIRTDAADLLTASDPIGIENIGDANAAIRHIW